MIVAGTLLCRGENLLLLWEHPSEFYAIFEDGEVLYNWRGHGGPSCHMYVNVSGVMSMYLYDNQCTDPSTSYHKVLYTKSSAQ